MPGQQKRLFVAIELPATVLSALGDVQSELRAVPGLDRLRWTRPEGIHLTLKFLGETDVARIPDIEAALTRAAARGRPRSLSLGRAGTFGGPRNPRVVWVDVEGETGPLLALQSAVEEGLAAAGFPKEDRRFSPHLTLARVRPETARSVAEPLGAAIQRLTVSRATADVRELSLMESELGRGGAVYTRVGVYPLGGG